MEKNATGTHNITTATSSDCIYLRFIWGLDSQLRCIIQVAFSSEVWRLEHCVRVSSHMCVLHSLLIWSSLMWWRCYYTLCNTVSPAHACSVLNPNIISTSISNTLNSGMLVTYCYLTSKFLSPLPNGQSRWLPLVSCPRKLIQHIRSYTPIPASHMCFGVQYKHHGPTVFMK